MKVQTGLRSHVAVWLWRRLAVMGLIQPLAWELPYTADVPPPPKKKKKNPKKPRKKKKSSDIAKCPLRAKLPSKERHYNRAPESECLQLLSISKPSWINQQSPFPWKNTVAEASQECLLHSAPSPESAHTPRVGWGSPPLFMQVGLILIFAFN